MRVEDITTEIPKQSSNGSVRANKLPGYNPTNPMHSTWARIFSKQRYEAQRRGLTFTVTVQDAWKVINDQQWRCALSGMQFTSGGAASRTQFSMDRIDSSKGYEPGNIQFTTLIVNLCKRNLSDPEFIDLCKKVAGYSG